MSVSAALLRDPRCCLGLGFGSGLLRPAPGTWGTLASLPFAVGLLQLPTPVAWLVVAIAALVGIHLCGHTAEAAGVHDHPAIVWDEFVGMWLTLLFVPFSWSSLVVGFALFRLFDIVKPWPIRWCDERVAGGLGIMLDDLLAGAFAGVVLWGIVSTGVLPAI